MEWFDSVVYDIDKRCQMDIMINKVFEQACLDIKTSLNTKPNYINLDPKFIENLVQFERISFNEFCLKITGTEMNFGIKELVKRTILHKDENIYDCSEEEIKETVQYFIKSILRD